MKALAILSASLLLASAATVPSEARIHKAKRDPATPRVFNTRAYHPDYNSELSHVTDQGNGQVFDYFAYQSYSGN